MNATEHQIFQARRDHQAADRLLSEQMARPRPDLDQIGELKRKKLRAKDICSSFAVGTSSELH